MTIETSNGFVTEVKWAWAMSLMGIETLMLAYEDDRPFSQIIPNWEENPFFFRKSEDEGDLIFEGFTKIVMINRPNLLTNPSEVEIHLVR